MSTPLSKGVAGPLFLLGICFLQIVASNLLRLLQTQCQFFHVASENITEFTRCQATNDLKSSVDHMTATSSPVLPARVKNGVKTEGLSIDAKSVPPHYGEGVKSPGLSSSVDSPGSLRKQISMFFSKLSPKTVAPSSEGQSVFFVGLEGQPQQQPQQSEPQPQQELVQQQQQQQQQQKRLQPEIKPKPRKILQQRGGMESEREEKSLVTREHQGSGGCHCLLKAGQYLKVTPLNFFSSHFVKRIASYVDSMHSVCLLDNVMKKE